MSAHDARIQPLPSDAVAKIKSSTSITHLNGVILELVKNSLDANSHTIIVTVDFPRGSCIVEDDGDGIPPVEFEGGGGLGKAHRMSFCLFLPSFIADDNTDTSKFQSEDVYGQRGLFLVSLAALSLLTITSHHSRHQTTNSVIFHHSKPVARLVPAPIHQELKFTNHGTRVAVNDLFGNMPVRVKSRALALQRPDELEKEWDDLRQLLVSVMLANGRLAKLVISDAGRSRKLTVRLPVELPLGTNPSCDWNEYDLRRIHSILVQAGIIHVQNSDSWNTVSACLPDLSIHAAISLIPSPTKKAQFISLGTNPVFARNNTNALYSEINRLFASSDFGTMGTSEFPFMQNSRSVEHQDGQSSAYFKGMSKAVNKWPMFYIRINTGAYQRISGDGYEVVPESDKSIQRIIDVLSAMINEFLKQHGLRPRAVKRKRKANEISQETGTGGRRIRSRDAKQDPSVHLGRTDSVSTEEGLDRRLRLPSFQRSSQNIASQDFGTWSRIKSARENVFSTGFPRAKDRPTVKLPDGQSDIRKAEIGFLAQDYASALPSTLRDLTLAETEKRGAESGEVELSDSSTDILIPWTDPCTKQTVLINSRTGQTMNQGRPVSASGVRPRTTGSIQTLRRFDDIRRPKSATPKTQNVWIENMLRKWENPVFNRSEKPIASTDVEVNCDGDHGRSPFGHHDCSGDVFGLEAARFAKSRGKLSRRDLETAEIIAQVDQKFILVKTGGASCASGRDQKTILVLIDQHAADERCRIEQLFQLLFTAESSSGSGIVGVQTTTVDPICFEIGTTEIVLFERYLELFGSWGICYKIEQKPTGSRTARIGVVSVYSLPALIAERCRLEPNLVTDLLRGEIWKREESGERPPRKDSYMMDRDRETGDTTSSWVERISGCPQGIIDLLNSRACRSAIMFNDVLSVEECQNLVSGLARCTFPFQCAHGRPSMIPILDLVNPRIGMESEIGDDGDDGDDGEGFLGAFRAWRGRG